MQNYFNKVKSSILAHKILSAIILIAAILVGNFIHGKITSTAGDTRYVTSKVVRSTLIASVSGTGQVSASNQIDLKPKVSGNVVYLGASNGQKVATGDLIVELDTTDAEKAVRDAQTNLEGAQIALEKLKIQNSTENLSADAKKAYNDGWNTVSNTILELTPTLDGLNTLLEQSNLSDNSARAVSQTAQDYRSRAVNSYYEAEKAFERNRKDYALLSNNSPANDIENIINETYATTKLLSDAIKSSVDFVDLMANDSNDASVFVSAQNTLSSYTSTINNDLASLLSSETNISNNKDSSQNADLDLQSAQLNVTQKENALQDAKDKLSDYFIRAPYSGTVANMNLKISDPVSTSTTVASLITDKQEADISLNEVDVAKIQLAEKATLTFDAVPDLTIAGVVGEIDSIGTVSQGVVTYNVKITFDTQDARVKPAMSVSASIITDMKQDVLVVPNSAVKSQNGTSYVEMFDAPLSPPNDGLIGSISKVAPARIPVEVGLTNDSQSEIVSGLNEGDEIVTRTILPTTTAAATAPSLFGSSPATRGGTGGIRTTPRGN